MEHKVELTVHASYFIVLTSQREETLDRSYRTLEKTCGLARLCGAERVILHPGSAFDSRERSLERFIARLLTFNRSYLPDGIRIYPETCGKRNQLGSENEILQICNEVPGCSPCLDFGHLRAFNGGGWETKADIINSLERVSSVLGRAQADLCHIHVAPIEYGAGGERRHRAYQEFVSESMQRDLFQPLQPRPYLPRPEDAAEAVFDLGISPCVVSECHDSQEAGALAMKRHYLALLRSAAAE
jgi:deoxyribonuclease-4